MCGIVGIYNVGNNKRVKWGTLQKMCDVIRHRGPDDEGYYINNDVGLGIRRLQIIDLKTGHQPIYNEDKSIVVVLNGEIYNFQELHKELEEKGHKFYTKTDTETIVHLYEEHGKDCVQYLRGMFAFAIWDNQLKHLFIAKDRIGKKPLYYTIANGSFVFSSEIKSILEYLEKTPEIDLESIDLFLTYQYIPSPGTIFKNINSLQPATSLVCNQRGEIKSERYWSLDFQKKTRLSFEDASKHIRDLLYESTKLRMISDVPFGAFLSGGHDSSIVVGLMSEILSSPIKTFTIGFDEQEFSEIKYARIVARHFKTDHHELIVKPNFIEALEKIVWHYGQPFADSSALPSYFVANDTRRYVTVALNGDGGDESFGGYLRYRAMKSSLYLSWLFKGLKKKDVEKFASLIPFREAREKGIFRYLYRFIFALSEPPERKNLLWSCIFKHALKQKLYTEKMKDVLYKDSDDYLVNTFKNAPCNDILDRAFYTDIMAYLPECLLVKMDIASMANSLEARSPFLDHKVIEFAATLPSHWKLHRLTTKYILKKTFEGFLPKEILHRGKQGFGIPVGKWFRENWRSYFKDIVLSKRALSRGYFKKESLEEMFYEHINRKMEHGSQLWALLMLELWHRIYIDKDIKIST